MRAEGSCIGPIGKGRVPQRTVQPLQPASIRLVERKQDVEMLINLGAWECGKEGQDRTRFEALSLFPD